MTTATAQAVTPAPPEMDKALDLNHWVKQAISILEASGHGAPGSYYRDCKAAIAMQPEFAGSNKSQLGLMGALENARRELEGLRHQITRAKTIGPAPAEMDRQAYDVEKRIHQLEAEFERGRAQLEKVIGKIEAHRASARKSIVTALTGHARALGSRVRELVKPDIDFLLANPHRCPAKVDSLVRQAARIGELADSLHGECGAVYAEFDHAVGEDVAVVVSGRS